MIVQHPFEGAQTPENTCAWLAEATVDGQHFEARSRRGAPAELARILVVASIPDQAVVVDAFMLGRWYRPALTYRSLHWLAGKAWEENASVPVRRVRYRDLSQAFGKGGAEAQNGGGTPAPVHPATPELLAAK